ncbi:MAG: amidase [Acidimicrobiia bacterium]|nr:amidase [Acidimicrobiia bacterium]
MERPDIDAQLIAIDATSISELVRCGDVSARDVMESSLRRIEELEPRLNAFRTVMAEEAVADANRIDSLPVDHRRSLPLAGVPVAIKDDTDVAGQSTMWGSAADRGSCSRDADVVARLRRAGAIVVGKTNVPELTLWPWTASQKWGVTRNPWDLDRTAGGSSGGSAVAVCTGMAALALGSDGGGSIRYPAGLTGLFGLKPQRDRVPLGVEHASGWHGLVALGPLTRSARDAALFLDAVAADPTSTTFRDAIGRPSPRLRIAVATNAPPGSLVSLRADRRHSVIDAADALSAVGHDVFEAEIDYPLASLWTSTVRLLAGARDDVASLPDPHDLERRTRSVARLGRLLPNRTIRRALKREAAIAASINAVFDAADVVLTPLCADPAPRIDACPTTGGLRSLRASNTSAWLVPWNTIGQPAVAVPTGLDDDRLPVGVHLAGREGEEATLLRVAAQLEAARTPPRWSPPRG